jgi:hypothetical protein
MNYLNVPKSRPSPTALLSPMVDWTFKSILTEGSPAGKSNIVLLELSKIKEKPQGDHLRNF